MSEPTSALTKKSKKAFLTTIVGNRQIWICVDKDTATEIKKQNDGKAIFLLSEIERMAGLSDDALNNIILIKQVFPGCVIVDQGDK